MGRRGFRARVRRGSSPRRHRGSTCGDGSWELGGVSQQGRWLRLSGRPTRLASGQSREGAVSRRRVLRWPLGRCARGRQGRWERRRRS
ncbi:proline-rich receptor-like protein kinase PERK9 [Iris pallida]|uniref:Proline-rich receptor-like protein kinase PERK9 n=1 Tax=Iris pallida TaxID=29817 RepID=A0AAX6G235_IRIPA|nr:proline-rich receptor-like protein kinase PERK9 [Iris pallida]